MPSASRQQNRDQGRRVARGDGRRGKPYEPFVYGRVVALAESNLSQRAIARQLKIPRSTIRSMIQRREQMISLSGHRPPSYPRISIITPEIAERLTTAVRQCPKTTYQDLLDEFSLTFSRQTLIRFFRTIGIRGWMCKSRPHLTERHAILRLEWCLRYQNWTTDDWNKVVFSDESTIQRGKGGRREYCLRSHEQKWDLDCLQTSTKLGGITCMIWGAFCVNLGRSELVIMRRRAEASGMGNGIDSQSYTDALEEGFLPFFARGCSRLKEHTIFQQDNAPIHKSAHTMDWFEDNQIRTIDWPPYSPDLNPIEQVWTHLKTKIRQNNPELDDLYSGPDAVLRVGEAAVLAWWEIRWSIFEALAESMPHRIQACIDAGGWHTRY